MSVGNHRFPRIQVCPEGTPERSGNTPEIIKKRWK